MIITRTFKMIFTGTKNFHPRPWPRKSNKVGHRPKNTVFWPVPNVSSSARRGWCLKNLGPSEICSRIVIHKPSTCVVPLDLCQLLLNLFPV